VYQVIVVSGSVPIWRDVDRQPRGDSEGERRIQGGYWRNAERIRRLEMGIIDQRHHHKRGGVGAGTLDNCRAVLAQDEGSRSGVHGAASFLGWVEGMLGIPTKPSKVILRYRRITMKEQRS
jgi:hypothetical protein